MDTEIILYEKRNAIAYITLNRPEVMNAFNPPMTLRLREILLDYRQDADLRVAIVTGAGDRAFSAGQDLKWRDALNRGQSVAAPADPEFPEVWKPIIAAINGYCIAGGLERALQCDIRIAAEHATFALAEPRFSQTPDYGLYDLVGNLSTGDALYLLTTAERIDAHEALRIGLVQKVVPQSELMAAAEQMAESIKLCAPLVVSMVKQVVITNRKIQGSPGRRLAELWRERVQSSEDAKEGPRAFAEKRPPAWKGR